MMAHFSGMLAQEGEHAVGSSLVLWEKTPSPENHWSLIALK